MMFRIAGLACFALCLVGCTGEDETKLPVMAEGDHDHNHDHGEHEHAETVGEAFHELSELHETVKAAFARDDADAAHDPLHDVGHILMEVGELADKSELAAEAKAAVGEQVEILMDAYGAVDKMMHDKDGAKEYSEVSEAIDSAMTALKAALGELAEHDHDDDHDDDHDHEGEDHDHDHKEGDHDDHDHDEEK